MEKGLALLILIMSLLGPLQYIIFFYFPPQGLVFNGFGTDDAMYFTAIKSYEFDFQSPLVLESDGIERSIFYNPAYGPIYMMIPLGIFHFLFQIGPLMIFIMFKFVSSVIFLAVSYFLIKRLAESRKEANMTFLIFAVTAGLGGILYMAFRMMTDPSQMLAPFSLFGFGIGVYRVIDMYYSFPFATSFFSFLLFTKNRHVLSGIFLGLTMLFYPLFAFVMSLTIFVYALLNKIKAKDIIKTALIPVPFVLIWALPFIKQPLLFKEYSSMLRVLSGHNLPSIFIGFGIAAFFAVYELCRKINNKKSKMNINKKLYLLSWAIAIVLVSLSQISQSYWITMDANVNRIFLGMNLFGLLSFINAYSMLFEIPFFVLLFKFTIDVLKKRRVFSDKYFFIISWLILVVFLVMAPLKYVPWVPVKISAFLALPISFMAAKGISRFSKGNAGMVRFILALVVISSLPSMFFFYLFEQNVTRNVNIEGIPRANDYYYTKSDYEALLFLKSQPFGTVLSSGEIGSFVPVYASKKSLLAGTNRSDIIYRFSEKYGDFMAFYSASDTDRLSIIKKYGITYVFYGEFEKGVDKDFSPESLEFLEKIYEKSGTYVYRVR